MKREMQKKKKSKLPLISTDIRFTKKARENKAMYVIKILLNTRDSTLDIYVKYTNIYIWTALITIMESLHCKQYVLGTCIYVGAETHFCHKILCISSF